MKICSLARIDGQPRELPGTSDAECSWMDLSCDMNGAKAT